MQSPCPVNASALRLDALIDQTYVRDDRPAGDASAPAVWFAYSPNRQGEHPQGHLKSFQGSSTAGDLAGGEKAPIDTIYQFMYICVHAQ
jgi:hypothetical protein